MPISDDEPSVNNTNRLLMVVAIVGFLFVCAGLYIASGNTDAPEPIPYVSITTTTELTPTPTPKITPYFSSTPSLHQVKLNYTFNSKPYQMIIPLDDNLALAYKNHETVYVCKKYGNDTSPCSQSETQQFYINYITDQTQDDELNTITNTIKAQTSNPDDQARIAISIVQQIPYDPEKASKVTKDTPMRFPYEVIYDQKGICSEKSMLLAALLHKLDYGTALFLFEKENHMAVGIQSPQEYSYVGSGYAFIETTNPSIITDASGEYSSFGKLSTIPAIYVISGGNSMISISQEYNDNIRYQQIAAMGEILQPKEYYEWVNLTAKYNLGET